MQDPFPHDDLELEYTYLKKPDEIHFQMVRHMEDYIEAYHKFCKKGYETQSIKARKNLYEIHKLSKKMRASILAARKE